MLCTFISHTKISNVSGTASVHRFYRLKACQISKVRASSYEITNKPFMTSNYDNTDQTTSLPGSDD